MPTDPPPSTVHWGRPEHRTLVQGDWNPPLLSVKCTHKKSGVGEALEGRGLIPLEKTGIGGLLLKQSTTRNETKMTFQA